MPGAGVVHHIKDGRRAKRDTCSTFPGHFLTAASAAARSRLKGMAGDTSMRDTESDAAGPRADPAEDGQGLRFRMTGSSDTNNLAAEVPSAERRLATAQCPIGHGGRRRC